MQMDGKRTININVQSELPGIRLRMDTSALNHCFEFKSKSSTSKLIGVGREMNKQLVSLWSHYVKYIE